MEQLLETQKKRLTFEQIAKKWAYRLEQAKTSKLQLKTNNILLGNPKLCIVGEAHGGTHNYGCDLCCDIGMMFFSFYSATKMYRENEFERVKEHFVEHWNQVHVKEF